MLKKSNHKILISTLAVMLVFWTAGPVLPVWAEEIPEIPPEITDNIEHPENIDAPQPPEEVEEISEPAGEVDIDTGDVHGEVDIENRVNVNENDVDTNIGDCLDDCQDLTNGEGSYESEDNLVVSNENEADVGNNVSGEGNSGGNGAADNDADINIDTGMVHIISNIFNLINVNFIGTNYIGAAYNLVGSILGDIDLSRHDVEELAEEVETNEEFQDFVADYEENEEGEGGDSETEITKTDSTEITNDNEADVDNEVNIEANSGLNEVIGNAGDVKIVTGDIFVASNLVNIVNTNVIGDGWTMTFINIMGEWTGDLVLPSLTNLIKTQNEDFSLTCDDTDDCLKQLEELDGEAEITSEDSLVITNNNEADVDNEVNVVGNSGGNVAADNEGDVDIETGDVNTVSQVVNNVNTNILDSGWVFGVVNVVGSWLGNIFGQPGDGFEVQDYGNYFTFSNHANNHADLIPDQETEDEAGGETGTTTDEFLQHEETECLSCDQQQWPVDEEPEITITEESSTTITNNNQADVDNVVNIVANSGGNIAAGNGGDVDIKTGDVNAVSNVVNLINSNIVGDDWTLAFINILGSWQGNIQFGKPDLLVTEVAQPSPDPAEPGGMIDYHIVITNKGDAPATEVEASADFDENLVVPTELDGGEVIDGKIVWHLDKVGIGEIIVKHYQAQIKGGAENEDEVANAAEAWAIQGDRNPDDNIAHTSVIVYGGKGLQVGWGSPVNTGSGNKKEFDSSVYANPMFNQALEIEKTNDSKGLVYGNQTVNYSVNLYNNSSQSLYDVIVYDDMFAPDGTLVNQESWKLGEVLPYEEINIEYSINFSNVSMPGDYHNLASADGFDAEGRYSVFPNSENVITLSNLNSGVAGDYVDIQYYYQANKTKGETNEETIIITNLAEDSLPAGQLVITFDGSNLSLAGETDGALKYDVPEISGGGNYTVQFDAEALGLTDGDLISLYYLTFGTPVASLTASYQITDEPAPVVTEVVGTGQVDDTEEQTVMPDREPRVLGYALGLNGGGTISPQNASSYFWQSLQDSLFTWWFWLGLVLLAALTEIYHRYRRGEKFWEKTFGFRIF